MIWLWQARENTEILKPPTSYQGGDTTFRAPQLLADVLVSPSYSPTWAIDLVNGDHVLGSSSSDAALAGYPRLSVPSGTSPDYRSASSSAAPRVLSDDLLAVGGLGEHAMSGASTTASC